MSSRDLGQRRRDGESCIAAENPELAELFLKRLDEQTENEPQPSLKARFFNLDGQHLKCIQFAMEALKDNPDDEETRGYIADSKKKIQEAVGNF